jgi:protein-S-isoprenylcysteine O-methyltransferase Ste14
MEPFVLYNELAGLVFGASVVLWVLVEYGLRVRGEIENKASGHWSELLIVIAIPTLEVGAIVATIHNIAPLPGAPWWPVTLGVAMIWIGMGLRVWAALTLSRAAPMSDSERQKSVRPNPAVVNYGPYRTLRHPGYLGAISGFAGFGLVGGGWASVVIMVAGALTVFVIRIRVEEDVLLREFGEEYVTYMRATARLIPGVF